MLALLTFNKEVPFSEQIDMNMSEFGSYRITSIGSDAKGDLETWRARIWRSLEEIVVNPLSRSKKMQARVANAEPFLGLYWFFNWLLACPCCSRKVLVRTRERWDLRFFG